MNRIDETFGRLRASGRLGLFPYLTAGFPALDATERLAMAALDAGADGLELGVPFSDPLADGATQQRASEVALRNGASLAWTLDLAGRIRRRADAPLVLMTYYNPVHHFGLEAFAATAVTAGIDGVIVPDLPSGEATPLTRALDARGLHLIQMVAPTTTPDRLAEVGRTASGFVYCVSLLGTTGARATLSDRLPLFMKQVRSHVSQPLLVGFGISRPEHIASIRGYADAVVVASAIADMLEATPAPEWETAVRRYVTELRSACNGSGSA
jgi:tryptophan synthase alpha chain